MVEHQTIAHRKENPCPPRSPKLQEEKEGKIRIIAHGSDVPSLRG
jgi:hypothetical protein